MGLRDMLRKSNKAGLLRDCREGIAYYLHRKKTRQALEQAADSVAAFFFDQVAKRFEKKDSRTIDVRPIRKDD